MSAVVSFWPASGRLEALAAFPGVPSLDRRGEAGGVEGLYSECARPGELVTLGHRTVNVPALMREALERFGRPSRVAADRWREGELRDALAAAGVPAAAFEPRGQGYKDGGQDVRAFQHGCAEGRVTPLKSLLLRSAMSQARTVSDPAGNSNRLGPMPPEGMVQVRSDAFKAVLASCGCSVAMFDDTDGTSKREELRQFYLGTVQPLAKILEWELSAKLEADVGLGFDLLQRRPGRTRSSLPEARCGRDGAERGAGDFGADGGIANRRMVIPAAW